MRWSNRSLLSVLLGVAFFFGSVMTTRAQLTEILQAMDTNNRTLVSLRADIAMSKWDAALKVPDPLTQGSTQYLPKTKKRPMYARIDWRTPREEHLAIQGDQYKLYQPHLKQMLVGVAQKGKGNAGNALGFISMSRSELRANFDVVYLGEEALKDQTATWHLQLTPKRAASYKIADLWVDRAGMPRQAKITELNNDTTTVMLTKVNKNADVIAKDFDIVPPKGVVIVKR